MVGDLSIPWVEKYRPRSLKDVSGQRYTIRTLQKFVENGSFPHMIFTGPAGTGKTSAAMSFIHDVLQCEHIPEDALLERNASDECRMENLPEIKNFVFHTGVQIVKYKFIVLDEADNLSTEVQSALRRIIETAPPNVKFIFMCNYVERIIGPILSRCAIFRFYPLPKEDFVARISAIANNERIEVDGELLDVIYYISQGDMRNAINLFQMIVSNIIEMEDDGTGSADNKRSLKKIQIDIDVIFRISGYLTIDELKRLFTYITMHEFDNAVHFIRNMRQLSSRALFRQFMDVILLNAPDYPLLEKLIIILGEYDYRLTLEADPIIQLDGFISELISLL